MDKYNITMALSIIALLVSTATIAVLLQNEYEVFSEYDLNDDGKVNEADLEIVRDSFGTDNLEFDFNDDGKVNVLDLIIVRNNLD